MSLSSQVARNDYVANGIQTAYAYTFKVFNSSELRVIATSISGVETVLVEGVDYNVSGVRSKTGGNVTFVSAPVVGLHITILRNLPLTQSTDFRNTGDVFPETIEDAFDRSAMALQQQEERISRAIKLPRHITSADFDPVLPSNIQGAVSQVLITNPAGTKFQMGPTITDISTAISLVPQVTQAVIDSAGSAADAAQSAIDAAASEAAALTSATNAATSASGAQTARTGAEAASQLAKDWATLTSTTVDGLEYSAKYYAQAAAAQLAAKLNRAGDTMTGALALQNIIRLEQEVNSALNGANVTLAPVKSNYRFTGAVTSISTITPPLNSNGTLLILTNGSGTSVTLKNAAGGLGSIITGTGADAPMIAGASYLFFYDNATSAWEMLGGGASGGSGLPNGGTTGQVLAKNSGTNGDADWFTLTKNSIGLSNVDNTADATKNVLSAVTAQNVTGTVAIANGGTGATNRQGALDNLVGTQNAGKFLKSDGVNTTLQSILASDVPTLNQNTTGTASNVTGIVAKPNGGTGADNSAVNFPASGTIVTRDAAETLTNKTLTSPAITTPTGIVKGDVGLGNVDNTSDATKNAAVATLANKTLTSPVINTGSLTSPSVTDQILLTAQASTPTTPATGKVAFYPKTTDKKLYYLNDAGIETLVGAGAGGGTINYVTNPDFDTDLSGWRTYKDAAQALPVDGINGSPALTLTRSTTNPLRGNGSGLISKPASNVQGEGVSIDLSIMPIADRGKVLQIAFDFNLVSGTYADGDLSVYIYSIDSLQVIPPSTSRVISNVAGLPGRFIATFQTDTTSQYYRLILHSASTSAVAYTAQIDNVSVGPQVSTIGYAASDWKDYGPLTIASTGTAPTKGSTRAVDRLLGRRNGANFEFRIEYFQTVAGANGTGVYKFTLPAGMSIDLNLVTPYSGTDATSIKNTVGSGYLDRTGAQGMWAYPYVFDANSIALVASASTSTSTTYIVGGTTGISSGEWYGLVNGNQGYQITGSVPIAGWSSGVQMSSDAGDGRRVIARYANNVAVNPGANQPWNYDLKEEDTHNAVTTGTGWKFTAPYSDTYTVAVVGFYGGTTDTRLYKNGSYFRSFASSTANFPALGSVDVYLQAGENIDVRGSAGGTPAAWGGPGATVASSNSVTIKGSRYSSQAIAATETIAASYYCSANQAGSATAPFNFDTKETDTHGAVTVGAAWKFTAPATGRYRVAITANNVTGSASVYVYKGGVLNRWMGSIGTYIFFGSPEIPLLQGESIDIRPGGSMTIQGGVLASTTNVSQIYISRVGNY